MQPLKESHYDELPREKTCTLTGEVTHIPSLGQQEVQSTVQKYDKTPVLFKSSCKPSKKKKDRRNLYHNTVTQQQLKSRKNLLTGYSCFCSL